MGRHSLLETPPPPAPAPPTRHRRPADADRTGRPRRRTATRLLTVGLGGALALAVVPALTATGRIDEVEATVVIDAQTAGWWSTARRHSGRERTSSTRSAPTAATPTAPSSTGAPTSTAGAPTATSGAAPPGGTPPPALPAGTSPARPAPPGTGLLGATTGAVQGILAGTADLRVLPTSGPAWDTVVTAATSSGAVDLVDQDNTHAARTLAAALVYARTGDPAQRDRVVADLRKLPGASLSGARVLSVARQLGGYGRWTTIRGTSEDAANNWGIWAMATRIAISAYLGDRADLERAATVFRGFTGERVAYAGFRRTGDFDATSACGGEAWVPINPASCGERGGAIVEDISRSAGSYPAVDSTGLTYSWEVLGGATLSARLLERAGYREVWQWGDRALLRAATFLRGHGGYAPAYRVNQYIPHEINAAYGVDLGPVGAAGFGRQFGFTDWLR